MHIQPFSVAITPRDASLYGIVDDLISEAAPLAVHNRNYVVNNVPADLQVQANNSIISSVLNRMFQSALRHTQNAILLISAKVYGHVVLVQVKSKGQINPGLTEDLGHASMRAQKTGGVVELTQYETEQASIAYCFLNVAGEA